MANNVFKIIKEKKYNKANGVLKNGSIHYAKDWEYIPYYYYTLFSLKDGSIYAHNKQIDILKIASKCPLLIKIENEFISNNTN